MPYPVLVRRSTLWLLTVTQLVLISTSSAQHLRTVDYPGATNTFLNAINSEGDVAGYYTDSVGVEYGFFTRNHQFREVTISGLPGTAYPWGISDDYIVVGYDIYYRGFTGGFGAGPNHFRQFYTAFQDEYSPVYNITPTTGIVSGTFGEGPYYGFYYLNGQYYKIVYPGSSGLGTTVTGENDQGQFVGTYFIGSSEGGFLYDGISTYTAIDYPAAISTTPNRISNTGEIVGSYQLSDKVNHGFTYVNGIFASVDFPEATDTQIFGVNASGTIVGRYTDSSGIVHGFEGTP
jgi:hypothetical protein